MVMGIMTNDRLSNFFSSYGDNVMKFENKFLRDTFSPIPNLEILTRADTIMSKYILVGMAFILDTLIGFDFGNNMQEQLE